MKNKLTNLIKPVLVCLFLFWGVSVQAQNRQNIDLVLDQVTFKAFLHAIESKTDYRFMYDGLDINSVSKITVSYKNTRVQSILDKELLPYGIGYQINGNQIVLIKKASKLDTPWVVKGTITDLTGEPAIGAAVVLKGNVSVGTIADIDGNYTITIPQGTENPVLVYSLVGLVSKEETVNKRAHINVTLKENEILLSEVVVVGYGSVKKSDATGALDVIKDANFNKGIVSSPEMLLNGHVAGVQITPGSGQPGANTSVRIRGISSISASSEPLYVIDGVPVDNTRKSSFVGEDAALSDVSLNPLSTIAPADIESMTILKDASATAIYGSRGANGVIIITTKGGKDGVRSVNYSSSVGIATVSKKIDVLSADKFRHYVSAANKDVSTDWQEEIFRTAFTQDHNLTFSNGTKQTAYRASLSMSDQPGIVLNTGFKRYTLRLNATHKMFDDRLVLSVNANHTHYNFKNLLEQQSGGSAGGVLNNALKGDPTQPVYNKDGSFNEYSEENFRNPVAMSKQISDKTTGDRFIANADAEFFFIPKELSLKATIGYDVDHSERKAYQPRTSILASNVQGRSVLDNMKYAGLLTEVYGTYNKVFAGCHALNLVGGYSWQEYETNRLSIKGEGYTTDILGADNIEGAKSVVRSNVKEINRLISFYGRINYGLMDKYMFTATVRRDGSSRFGSNNKWGIFPSGAFAWKVKEEGFMKNISFISDLKLRLGYGITGNQDIGNFIYDKTYSVNSQHATMWNQQLMPGYIISGISNPNLKWEETAQFNAGIDYAFVNNRFRGAIDFYRKVTSNLLLEVDAIQPAVASKFLDNVGEMTNTGVEFSINGTVIDHKDFNWNSGFNIAYNKNKITKLNNDRDIYYGVVSGKGAGGYPQLLRVGEAFGTFYGKKFKGFEEIVDPVTGRKACVETFEDGEHILGNALPDITLGLTNSLSYKNVDLSSVFRSALGAEVFNNTRAELENGRLPNMNTNTSGAEFYQKGGGGITYVSSRWIENASFLRLDNLTIGYTFTPFPKVVKSARVFATVQNLFVITSYSGYDPEVNNQTKSGGVNSTGTDYCSYPHARTFQFGLNLNF